MELEEPEHPLLGNRLHLWLHARRGREAVLGHRHQGPARFVRAEEGQRQQGHHRLEHHVHRWTVSAFPPRPLAVPEDSREQAVRIHARDSRGCPGHGLRYVHQDCTKVQEAVRPDPGGGGDALHRRAAQQHQLHHLRSPAATSMPSPLHFTISIVLSTP